MIAEPQPRIAATGFGFIESPRWHDGRLFASDIALRQVIAIDFSGGAPRVEVVARLDDQPSGLGWMPDGSMLVVAMRTRRLLRVRGGEVSVHADFSGAVTADINDMVVDADGRAYVTNFGYEADAGEAAPTATGILIVEPDGRFRMTPAELYRPNGCVITPDGRTFIVAETRLHRLTAYARAADGELSDRRAFAVTPSPSWADGICLDAEGAVWIGDPKGRQITRVRAGGEITHRIPLAPRQGIACALGGPARRTLYYSSVVIKPWDVLARERDCRIEAVEVDVPGAGWP
ncbi:MAG: SMP-30/gluconolactonase/LRE family protein [Gammaproteobacteria bacterium]